MLAWREAGKVAWIVVRGVLVPVMDNVSGGDWAEIVFPNLDVELDRFQPPSTAVSGMSPKVQAIAVGFVCRVAIPPTPAVEHSLNRPAASRCFGNDVHDSRSMQTIWRPEH